MSHFKEILEKIEKKQAVVGIVGLGYVGLPLAVEIAQAGYKTIGFDVQPQKVDMVNKGVNYIGDIVNSVLEDVVKSGKLSATSDFSFIKDVDCVAICVPTPLDQYQQPDISYVKGSTSRWHSISIRACWWFWNPPLTQAPRKNCSNQFWKRAA